jgi:adenylosuccinate synthase
MKRAFIVGGLAWGDEGKGATVDFLALHHGADLVVRYNGGPQAGHNVVTPTGLWHEFHQFGSASFLGVPTHLSRFMLVEPISMMEEAKHLEKVGILDAWKKISVDPDALVITPFHRELNRLQTDGTHTSCGRGIGTTRHFHILYGDKVLFVKDLLDERVAIEKLRFIQDRAKEQHAAIDNDDSFIQHIWARYYATWRELVSIRTLPPANTMIFEGAQGVLLDELHGTQGFNTWTDCTFGNAFKLLHENNFDGQVTRVGVIRTYYTRHGAGPFPTENPSVHYPEPHNLHSVFQGKFRQGYFDVHSFHDALRILQGIDMLAVNHMDCYKSWFPPLEVLELPHILGRGPTRKDREFIKFS